MITAREQAVPKEALSRFALLGGKRVDRRWVLTAPIRPGVSLTVTSGDNEPLEYAARRLVERAASVR